MRLPTCGGNKKAMCDNASELKLKFYSKCSACNASIVIFFIKTHAIAVVFLGRFLCEPLQWNLHGCQNVVKFNE